MFRSLTIAAAVVALGSATTAVAQNNRTATTTVNATLPDGNSFYTGAVTAADFLNFRATGESFLQNNGGVFEYGTNAAGVLTTGSSNNGGGQYPTQPGGTFPYTVGGQTFDYGALLVTFTPTIGSALTAQFFPANTNGAGSVTPPRTFLYNNSFGTLFGSNFSGGTGTLSFRVADTGFDDNSGGFTVTAVPEPAAWALMIVGFGAIGAVARRRRTTVRATFA